MKHDSLKQYVSLRQSLTAEKARLEARLRDINAALGGTSGGAAGKTGAGKRGGKRHMSAEARALISAAQKKRWAKVRAAKKSAAK
jgi:hypothetical protein